MCESNEEYSDMSIGEGGIALPPANEFTALIDADTIVYNACVDAEVEEIIIKDDYSEEEWQTILADNGCSTLATAISVYRCNEELAMANIVAKIQKIFDLTGCRKAQLHLTMGRAGFRYKLESSYKANRVDKRVPAGLTKMKTNLWLNVDVSDSFKALNLEVFAHENFEADDAVVFLKKADPTFILVALDKDVLNAVAGTHFNYYESSYHNIDMKWCEVTESQARMWPYLQCIVGDTSDNIKGCPGIGPKKALKFINENMSASELWEGLVRAYESVGLSQIEALATMNLVNMNLLTKTNGEFKIKLFEPEV